MSHILKKVWIEASGEHGLYCEKCEKVYAEDEVRAGTCPSILSYNCNMCTESMVEPETGGDIYGAIIKFSTGFYSDLPDGYHYRFRLCECCIEKMFSQFEIPPERKSYIGGEQGEHRWHLDSQYEDNDENSN